MDSARETHGDEANIAVLHGDVPDGAGRLCRQTAHPVLTMIFGAGVDGPC